MSSFPVLSDHDYLNFVGAIRHRGANESTHVAEVRYPVQRAGVTSVVKLMRPDGIGLCNEAIAWLFLRAIGLPVPQHAGRSEEHTSELQSPCNIVCRLLLEKKKI